MCSYKNFIEIKKFIKYIKNIRYTIILIELTNISTILKFMLLILSQLILTQSKFANYYQNIKKKIKTDMKKCICIL